MGGWGKTRDAFVWRQRVAAWLVLQPGASLHPNTTQLLSYSHNSGWVHTWWRYALISWENIRRRWTRPKWGSASTPRAVPISCDFLNTQHNVDLRVQYRKRWDFIFSQEVVCRQLSSGILQRVVWLKFADVSEVFIAAIIRATSHSV
jgi:hypothetical protein